MRGAGGAHGQDFVAAVVVGRQHGEAWLASDERAKQVIDRVSCAVEGESPGTSNGKPLGAVADAAHQIGRRQGPGYVGTNVAVTPTIVSTPVPTGTSRSAGAALARVAEKRTASRGARRGGPFELPRLGVAQEVHSREAALEGVANGEVGEQLERRARRVFRVVAGLEEKQAALESRRRTTWRSAGRRRLRNSSRSQPRFRAARRSGSNRSAAPRVGRDRGARRLLPA